MKSVLWLVLFLLSYSLLAFSVFDIIQERNNQNEFLQELIKSPWDVYKHLLHQYKINSNFSFPASGFALAQIEIKLRELISHNPNLLKAHYIIARLPVLKGDDLPYQSTKEFITETMFFLQDYFDSTGQLVSEKDVWKKYHKTQNYDYILGEYNKNDYNYGFNFFYLFGELDITFFNRTWHLPFSPLEVSTKPINTFDHSVGGPRAVISHDLVHHKGKSTFGNIDKREILINKLNTIVNNYRECNASLESVVNAIELIRFIKHHETYNPKFSLIEFKENINDAREWLISNIVKRVRSGEFAAKYNVDSLEDDLQKAIEILLEGLTAPPM